MTAAPTPAPQDDPAARFRKPDPNAPPEEPQERVPRPQTLGQMLEDTLTAPFQLGALFSELAKDPPPGYAVMIGNLAVYWAAMLVVNLLHAAIVHPDALRYSPALMGVVGASALLGIVVFSFAGAAVLHAAAVLAGGTGGYARSYQVFSLLSFLAPVQAMVNATPWVWGLPTVAGVWLAVLACQHLHQASTAKAWTAFGVLAAVWLGAQWLVRLQVERISERYQQAAAMSSIAQQIEQLKAQGALAAPEGGGAPGIQTAPGQQSQALLPVLTQGLGTPLSGSPGQFSGLDMVSNPAGPQGKPSAQQVAQLQQNVGNMMGTVLPLLSNPALTKGMPPAQAKQLQDMLRTMTQLQGSVNSGKPLSPKDRAALLQQAQQMQLLLPQLMQGMSRTPPAAQGGPAPEAPGQQR